MLPLYAITLGLSALLLFWVQPLYARMTLPLLGGAPAVWITAMLFFQAALLAGYLYTHLSIRWLGLKQHSLLHGVLLLLAFVAMPIAVPEGWAPPTGAMPVDWLIALMAAGVGLPFFAVSATAPLLQRWFAHTGHAESANPYFLYGASNIGSIAALVGYPVLAEPLMRLGEQSRAWTGLYILLVLLIGVCGLAMWRRFVADPPGVEGEALELSPDISWRRRLWWIAFAFAPSSLMLGVTLHISTDIAAVPQLWVIPLALYLLSFVVVFARRPILPHRWMLVLQVPALLLLAVAMSWELGGLFVESAIHLVGFFVIATACHGELAARRPAALHLTEFYLWMAIGGVLGGIFNAVIAPILFDSVLEYPLMIAAVAVLRPWRRLGSAKSLTMDILLPAGLAMLAIGLPLGFERATGGVGIVTVIANYMVAVAATAGFALMGRPLRLALGIAVVLAAGPLVLGKTVFAGPGLRDALLWERSFFGVHRVVLQTEPLEARVLLHGTTVHGAQFTDPAKRRIPLTYHDRAGPLGQVFKAFPRSRFPRVGVVGLGAGATACYATRGQEWTFFEIDPKVERIARDPRYFTYLSDCAPEAKVTIGDARLSLWDVPDGHFDLLVLDAFSSDAVPVHLMTVEAFRLYRRKISERGILMANISNRFLDLEPVVARVALETDLFGVVQYFNVTAEENARSMRFPSIWTAMARRPDYIRELASDPRWKRLRGANALPWTDDHVNIMDAIFWW